MVIATADARLSIQGHKCSGAINDMRAGAGDSEKLRRTLSSRGRFLVYEDGLQEVRPDPPKSPTGSTATTSTTNRPSSNRPLSALKSTGHRLIHDELPPTVLSARRDTPPKTPRESSARLSGRFQMQNFGVINSVEEVPPTTSRLSHAPSQRLSVRLQPQDIEQPRIKQDASSAVGANGSSRTSTAEKVEGLERLNEIGPSAQSPTVLSPNKNRPPSPVHQPNDVPVESPVDKKASVLKAAIPLAPIRQNSQRPKPPEDGLATTKQQPVLKPTKPSSPSRQLSDRLQIHDNGAITSRRDPLAETLKESVATRDTEGQNDKGAQQCQYLSDLRTTPEICKTPTPTSELSQSPVSRFVPLHTQWTYGQVVFARYKKTPCFYSGNIATYLGAGMFMVVFDDGTLDYRVRREDIMLREYPTRPSSNQQRRHKHPHEKSSRGQRSSEGSNTSLRFNSFEDSNEMPNTPVDTNQRRGSQSFANNDQATENELSMAPEMNLPPLHHVMVDFSVAPPREVVLSFDDSVVDCVSGCDQCCISNVENQSWRQLLEDETLTMKRLDCGVGYEDDSTQVSDSDESSEEDMSMTPWQQMTQTFGMGKAIRGQRGTARRSSISSVSQLDRSSLRTHGLKQTASPKSLKQIITDYFTRGNKKVQPSKRSEELALIEHIRLMNAKLYSMKSAICNSTNLECPRTAFQPGAFRAVFERALDGVRTYGTVTQRLENGDYAVVTEDEQSISMQAVPEDKLDFLPSTRELEQQLQDLERSQRVLFAGQKVNIALYPGSRFSGPGLITQERDVQSRFHVLLSNRIRLVNVPADKITPIHEKKKAAVTITEDQFLVCYNKVKVYIGDQIFVKCITGNGDFDDTVEEEKLGLLNGIYSNQTAAVDFADGSTGYEIPRHLIYKRKKQHVPADQDVRSLKNAVLMGGTNPTVLEEGYQVKADHPSKATVETCIVIKTHASSACDLRFSDGTIAFEVFPSQMILDSVELQRPNGRSNAANERVQRRPSPPVFAVGDYVLAWSSRFGRYCSAKIVTKTAQDTHETAPVNTMHTLVFDYGEYKSQVPLEKITHIDDPCALTHSQRLTNFSIDAMGFELLPVIFTVGEPVMARVHGSARYFNGVVEVVDEKERNCTVLFDSSERDQAVPFSAMFSVDSRSRQTTRSTSTKRAGSGSSSSEATSKARFISRNRLAEDGVTAEVVIRPRRHSSGSVTNVFKSVADTLFRSSKPQIEPRRGSQLITEHGARRVR